MHWCCSYHLKRFLRHLEASTLQLLAGQTSHMEPLHLCPPETHGGLWCCQMMDPLTKEKMLRMFILFAVKQQYVIFNINIIILKIYLYLSTDIHCMIIITYHTYTAVSLFHQCVHCQIQIDKYICQHQSSQPS